MLLLLWGWTSLSRCTQRANPCLGRCSGSHITRHRTIMHCVHRLGSATRTSWWWSCLHFKMNMLLHFPWWWCLTMSFMHWWGRESRIMASMWSIALRLIVSIRCVWIGSKCVYFNYFDRLSLITWRSTCTFSFQACPSSSSYPWIWPSRDFFCLSLTPTWLSTSSPYLEVTYGQKLRIYWIKKLKPKVYETF